VENPRNMRVGLRVLVVDDDPLTLMMAERMLTTKLYHVTTAIGGGEALKLLNTEAQFDLVLSNLYMSGMDGFQLLEIVRAVYNIPFIFMSSDHKLDVMERGLEAGARFFFPKPLTVMNCENMWQFVYIENVEYFQGMNIEDQG
ncbi:Two-component response regulator, partial [Thalictrum thalictroides]